MHLISSEIVLPCGSRSAILDTPPIRAGRSGGADARIVGALDALAQIAVAAAEQRHGTRAVLAGDGAAASGSFAVEPGRAVVIELALERTRPEWCADGRARAVEIVAASEASSARQRFRAIATERALGAVAVGRTLAQRAVGKRISDIVRRRVTGVLAPSVLAPPVVSALALVDGCRRVGTGVSRCPPHIRRQRPETARGSADLLTEYLALFASARAGIGRLVGACGRRGAGAALTGVGPRRGVRGRIARALIGTIVRADVQVGRRVCPTRSDSE